MLLGGLCFLTACSSSSDFSIEELTSIIQDLDDVTLPEKTIIALGEATHGNKELNNLKLSVFQKLVDQQDARVFALEGDIGASRKINDYISAGEGRAEEVVKEIGFAIYRTQEIVDLLEWIRSFNESRELSDQIRFYGYDMQRYDNSKEELFDILERSLPELAEEYKRFLDGFTNDTMYDLDAGIVKETIEGIEELNSEIKNQKDLIIEKTSEKEFVLAQQYSEAIKQNSELRIADKDYGTICDRFMAENVIWIWIQLNLTQV